MGLFGDLKMMVSTVKDCIDIGVADFKACDQMEKLIEEARTHKNEKGFLTTANLRCISEYDAAKKAEENKSDKLSTEESNQLVAATEAKQLACMTSFQQNPKFSQEFRNSCKEAAALYEDANDDNKLFDSMEKNMLKNYKFKDETEKKMVHELFAAAKKNSAACDQMKALIDEAKTHTKTAGFLTAADKQAIADYDAADSAAKANKNKKKQNELNNAIDEKEAACMTAFQKNAKFSAAFRNSCREALKTYQAAENAIEKLKEYQ